MKTSQAKLQLWSETGHESRLVASRDRRTGEVHFPVFRSVSPLAADHETIALSQRGALYSYTIIHPSPKSGPRRSPSAMSTSPKACASSAAS